MIDVDLVVLPLEVTVSKAVNLLMPLYIWSLQCFCLCLLSQTHLRLSSSRDCAREMEEDRIRTAQTSGPLSHKHVNHHCNRAHFTRNNQEDRWLTNSCLKARLTMRQVAPDALGTSAGENATVRGSVSQSRGRSNVSQEHIRHQIQLSEHDGKTNKGSQY